MMDVRKTPFGILLLPSAAAVSSSALDAEGHHPSSETSLGRRDDVPDLPADFVKAKEGPARLVETLADRREMQSVSPAVQLLAVTLHPAD
jgi:hypothetical protein